MSFRRKNHSIKKVRKYIKPIMNKISSFWLYDNGKLHIFLIHVPNDRFHVILKSYMRIHIINCRLLWHEKNLMVVYCWLGQPWWFWEPKFFRGQRVKKALRSVFLNKTIFFYACNIPKATLNVDHSAFISSMWIETEFFVSELLGSHRRYH